MASPIVMNILAYLAILCLLGFIGAVAMMATTVLGMVQKGKATVRLIDPPKRSVMGTIGVVKGIGLQSKERFLGMAASAKSAAASVTHVKDEVTAVVASMQIDEAKQQAQDAAEYVKQRNEPLIFARELFETIRKAQAAQSR